MSPPSPTNLWVVSHHHEQPDVAALGWSDADPGSTRELRNSTALRQLADLGPDPGPSPWAWAIVRLDPKGRVVLPPDARLALGVPSGMQTSVHGICHRVALVLSPDGAGAAMTVDSRGRLGLPTWLRRGPTGVSPRPASLIAASWT